MDVPTAAIVLAGGEGKRMLSEFPQVLQEAAGVPLVSHAASMVLGRGWSPLVVVVNPANASAIKQALSKKLSSLEVVYKEQPEAKGILDAVEVGLQGLQSFVGNVLVLPANMPLLQADTTLLCLEAMIGEGMNTAQAPFVGLVQRGAARHLPVFCAEKEWLLQALRAVNGHLTADAASSSAAWLQELQQALPSAAPGRDLDAISRFAAKGFAVNAASEDDLCTVATRADLANAERIFQGRLIAQHQAQGVTFRDPRGTFLGADVVMGRDTVIGVGVQIYGQTVIGQRVRIEGPTTVTDSSLEDGVFIRSFSVLEGAHVASGSGAGPFARLREGSIIGSNSYIGNFVETKNARLGSNTLACHLAYLGDAQVGSRTNVGAGTITCNFNGVSKNTTSIGDGCFVGSNSTLVAPVKIRNGAVVAAGSVITDDVPEQALAFGRARQTVKEGAADTLRAKLRQRSQAS